MVIEGANKSYDFYSPAIGLLTHIGGANGSLSSVPHVCATSCVNRDTFYIRRENKEMARTLEEIRQSATANVEKYNMAIIESRYEDAKSIMNDIETDVSEHVDLAQRECFAAIRNGHSTIEAMIEACKQMQFESIRAREVKDSETGTTFWVLEDVLKNIDLMKLHKFCAPNGIGADVNWIHTVQKFNCLLTAQVCTDLGIKPTDVLNTYSMSDVAKQIDMGKNPCSTTNLKNTMKTVIQQMIGEQYTPVAADTKYLMYVYAKAGRKVGQVSTANHKSLTWYLANVCHRLITGSEYTVDYKKAK